MTRASQAPSADVLEALDEALGTVENVYAAPYRFRGDRRNMKAIDRRREESHIVIRAEVCLTANDDRAVALAQALAETLARFGF